MGKSNVRGESASRNRLRKKEENKGKPKYKRVKGSDGKVYIVSSTDGGKSWTKPKPYNSKEYKTGFLGRPLSQRKNNLKVNKNEKSKYKQVSQKELDAKIKERSKPKNTPFEDDNDAADRREERVFRSSSSGKIAKEKHAKNTPRLEDDDDAADRREERVFRSSSSGEKAKDKHDPLRKYRRGPGTGRKDTRITKHLKKSGFTEDRLARLRKKHAEFKAKKKAFRENKRNKNILKKNSMGG
tara:strand:+ start:331 stop:1053 length:723 start_codon:yes stop_codon:yes gene_type:complete